MPESKLKEVNSFILVLIVDYTHIIYTLCAQYTWIYTSYTPIRTHIHTLYGTHDKTLNNKTLNKK